MPIYEFRCGDCGEEFSEIRRMGQDTGVPCPNCGSENTKKKISTFSTVSSSNGSSPACPSCPSAPCCPHGGME